MSNAIVFDNLINSEDGQENYAKIISLKPATENENHNAKGLICNMSAKDIENRAVTFGKLVRSAVSR
jgi:hypothetical protein